MKNTKFVVKVNRGSTRATGCRVLGGHLAGLTFFEKTILTELPLASEVLMAQPQHQCLCLQAVADGLGETLLIDAPVLARSEVCRLPSIRYK